MEPGNGAREWSLGMEPGNGLWVRLGDLPGCDTILRCLLLLLPAGLSPSD